MNIELSPRKVFVALLMIISFLLSAHIVGLIVKYYFHVETGTALSGIIGTFDLIIERNVPTLYSATALFVTSLLLLIITIKQKNMGFDYMGWYGLALIFLFLSYDEVAQIHERLTKIFHQSYDTSGLLYYAWVIPYGIMVLVFVATYLRFLMKLPKRIMILFIVSGTIFVTGAIGFEMLGGWYHELYGNKDLFYAVFYTIEELFEMVGIAFFIYTLLSYIKEKFGYLSITMKE